VPTTRIISVHPDDPDPAAIAEAAAILRAGGLVAFATETVYGLGADATDPEAVARIFEAKGRPATNPLIVHVADKAGALACVCSWTDRAELLADRFWPGPLTLVLPRSAIIPDLVTAGQDTVGVRVPWTEVARRLISQAGRPIAAPSANRSTGVSPTEAQHVLKDLDGLLDLILDSGRTPIGIESTVLDLSDARPRVLRPGRVTREQIAEALGEEVEELGDRPGPTGTARSPGQLAIHYAPRTKTYRLDRDRIPTVPREGGFHTLIFGEVPDPYPFGRVGPSGVQDVHWVDPSDASRDLYACLHQLDGLGLDFILIIPPPDEPRWRAVRDRIWRASVPWPGG